MIKNWVKKVCYYQINFYFAIQNAQKQKKYNYLLIDF
jgi:hypothetical protein